eukprot:scaffold867_cov229-Pinguiococcus_pyrenoidosus.AAC.3
MRKNPAYLRDRSLAASSICPEVQTGGSYPTATRMSVRSAHVVCVAISVVPSHCRVGKSSGNSPLMNLSASAATAPLLFAANLVLERRQRLPQQSEEARTGLLVVAHQLQAGEDQEVGQRLLLAWIVVGTACAVSVSRRRVGHAPSAQRRSADALAEVALQHPQARRLLAALLRRRGGRGREGLPLASGDATVDVADVLEEPVDAFLLLGVFVLGQRGKQLPALGRPGGEDDRARPRELGCLVRIRAVALNHQPRVQGHPEEQHLESHEGGQLLPLAQALVDLRDPRARKARGRIVPGGDQAHPAVHLRHLVVGPLLRLLQVNVQGDREDGIRDNVRIQEARGVHVRPHGPEQEVPIVLQVEGGHRDGRGVLGDRGEEDVLVGAELLRQELEGGAVGVRGRHESKVVHAGALVRPVDDARAQDGLAVLLDGFQSDLRIASELVRGELQGSPVLLQGGKNDCAVGAHLQRCVPKRQAVLRHRAHDVVVIGTKRPGRKLQVARRLRRRGRRGNHGRALEVRRVRPLRLRRAILASLPFVQAGVVEGEGIRRGRLLARPLRRLLRLGHGLLHVVLGQALAVPGKGGVPRASRGLR